MTEETQYDVFLSHSSADKESVEVIARRVRDEAGLQPWFDKWHLVPGTPWQEALEEALSQSQTCAVFIGPGGFGAWHQEEMRVALDARVRASDFRVIPVLLPGADLPERGGLPPFLTRHTWVDFRPGLDDPHAFHNLICGIKGVAPVEGEVPAEEAVCPYLGLRPFQEEHARFFFGRDAMTQWLVEDVRQGNFLAIIGPSGCGKSSLARAGLLPALRRGALPGSDRWPIRILTPGAEPVTALSSQLLPLLNPPDPIAARRSLTEGLHADPRELSRVVGQILAGHPLTSSGQARLLLLVDQFEELFTLCYDEAERAAFIAALLDATSPDRQGVVGVLTMRADFYGRAASYHDLAARLERRQRVVSPLDELDLSQAIERPARLVGLYFEKGLVDTILDDAGHEPGVLPLVQHTLWDLWQRRRGQWLTFDAYRAIGGVQGALAHRAEEIYVSFTPEEQKATRRVLLRLTQPGEGTEDTRRRASKAELIPDPTQAEMVERVVQKLADARLLTTAHDEETAQEVADVSHEALIQGWPRLRSWVDEDRAGLRTHRRLTETTSEWEQNNRDEGYLYRGARLAEAEEWAEAHADDMNPLEREFLKAGVEAREAERIAVRRRVQRIIVGLVAGLIIISVLAIFAWGRSQLAEQRRLEAEAQLAFSRSHQVAAIARNRLDSGDSQQALLLGIAAMRYTTETMEAANVLRSSLEAWRGEDILEGHTDRAAVAFSPNGQYLVSVSDDDTARLWQLVGERRVLVLRGHTGDLTGVAFSLDSRLLVTASRDGTVRVWEIPSGRKLYTLDHGSDIVAMALSPDGKTVATGGEDKLVWLWDLETGQPAPLGPFETEGAIQGVTFSPDGTFVVAASTDVTVWLWNLPSGGQFVRLGGYDTTVSAVVFSPDGHYLATKSGNTLHVRDMTVWDTNGPTPVAIKQAQHGATIESLAFSPDSTFLATGSRDTMVRLWDLRRLSTVSTVLPGHTGTVLGVLFSPDNRLLATTSWDNTVRLWRVEDGTLEAVLPGHAEPVWFPAFSPDGRWLATPDRTGVVRLWRAQVGGDIVRHSARSVPAMALTLMGEQVVAVGEDGNVELWNPSIGTTQIYTAGVSRLNTVAVSSDGSRLAVGGVDGQITMLDPATGAVKATWSAHANGVRALLFMPDDTHLASAGGDRMIRLWNLRTGELDIELRGHQNDVNGLVLGADATTLISASGDGTVRLWNWQTGEEQYKFDSGEPLLTVALGPDKRSLAAGGHGRAVHIWDLTVPDDEPLLLPHETAVRALAFGSGGQLASGDENGTIRLWDLQTREACTILAHGARWVSSLAFSPDGNRLFSTGGDGQVRVWPVQTADVLDLACRRAGRSLSRTEWEQFLPFLPFTELCPGVIPEQWVVSQQLDPPRPMPLFNLPVTDDRPTIHYFDAVPGASMRFGESVDLRWDGAGANEVYLEYGGQRHGTIAPNREPFSPAEDTTYRLVAVNDVGERTLTLPIFVSRE